MKTLIKVGGTLLDAPESRAALAAQIASFHSTNQQTVVVHGGGKQMTRFLTERGIESKFVNGLRVSTPDVIDAVLKVFAGTVNKELTGALTAAGASAVGISGIDGLLAEAEQLDPALGAVGRITTTHPALLHTLISSGFLPVVACVAGDRSGNVYNVNADQMAVACAAGFGAARLLFLTDVDGVRNGDGVIIPSLNPITAQQLISEGIATGGMQAKLDAACAALAQGVEEVVIAPGAAPAILTRLANPVEAWTLGTRLVRS